VSEDHADIPRDKLNRIVDDALRAALIHDVDSMNHHRPRARADGVPAGGDIRAESYCQLLCMAIISGRVPVVV